MSIPQDIGATICRCIVTVSLVGSYPIFMRGIKSSFFELFQKGEFTFNNMMTNERDLGFLTTTSDTFDRQRSN